MILSYGDIEKIAEKHLLGYYGRFFITEWAVKPIPVENFASDYLRLRLETAKLSDDGTLIGLTTYADTDIDLDRNCTTEAIHVKKDTILIDESVIPLNDREIGEIGRFRFTVIHECAHQIVFRMKTEKQRQEMERMYSMRSYTVHELKTLDDWAEWQANALAAAILMPKRYIDMILRGRRIKFYGKRPGWHDSDIFYSMCGKFGVSITAMIIRLKQLGYSEHYPEYEYHDPWNIICDDKYIAQQEREGILCQV